MSFSFEVKEELSKLNIYSNKELLKSELFGYLLSANSTYVENKVEFITENEFNIERIYNIIIKLFLYLKIKWIKYMNILSLKNIICIY